MPKLGKYSMLSTLQFSSTTSILTSSFTSFTPSVLHAAVDGKVVNGSGLKIEIDEDELEIYEKPLATYLLIAALILFIADVAVRVIKIKKKKGAKR